uniref:Max-binding protein MNT isoform X1 n=3 Tax=Pogona vitticeps TaxID=103695 RepID=A0ABM5EMM2_9SAUR
MFSNTEWQPQLKDKGSSKAPWTLNKTFISSAVKSRLAAAVMGPSSFHFLEKSVSGLQTFSPRPRTSEPLLGRRLRAMSIETLLEAARFLEWQAQQQQKTREENERHEKLCLEHEQEQKKASVPRVNHAVQPEEPPRHEILAAPLSPPAPAPPLPLPPPLPAPISVIPIPVVTGPALPVAQNSLSPPPVLPRHPPLGKDVPLVAPVIQKNSAPLLPDLKAPTPSSGSPGQMTHYPAPVLAISQHHVVPQPIQPQPPPHPAPQVLPAPPVPPLGVKMVPSEDAKPSEQKKRPGGVGTREVHNKLEKNRRAHLKECFETLKRNIPNVDDKKTSNLSVLRSALRYIQTLKRKEKEYEHEMERLAREKIATQQRLADLKNELSQWMDVLEIDRIIRQTVQPEDDQASTSTASEGEDNMDEEMEDDPPAHSLPKLAHRQPPELLKVVPPPIAAAAAAVQPHHHHHHHHPPAPVLPLGQKHASLHHGQPATLQPQALVPAQTHLVAASTVQSTVIAHTATTHASVIQTVNHVLHGAATAAATAAPQAKHIAHIAPSTSSPVQLTPAGQPIGHITVHPAALNHVAQLGQHLPLYPQPVAVSQPAVSHIAHTLSHQQVNGTAGLGQPAVMAKPPVGTQVVHHPQLVGQTVLNPVTMVTMPSFPVSTLKLA